VTANEVAAAAVVAAEAAAAETAAEERVEAPALIEARAQALLIGPTRLILAVGGLAVSRARGVESDAAAGLFGVGAGLLLFAVLTGARRRRAWVRIEHAEPAAADVRVESLRRSLAAATYPSTIGLTALIGVALWRDARLAALLAGILAGLGVAALAFAAELAAWERRRGGQVLVERGSGGRVFLRRY
jgi:hypothetical protein